MTMIDRHEREERRRSQREGVEALKASGALDDLFAKIDAGQVQLEGKNGLIQQLIKAGLERGLQTELTGHVGYEKGDPEAGLFPNSRNGSFPKTVATSTGDVELAVPRDRDGSFIPMSITQTAAPALPADLEALMRQLKMPYARALAPELIATAKSQRWEPAEVIKALFVEEVTGRSRSMLATRREAAGFPTGKTFDTWDESDSSIPVPTQQALRTLEWIGRKENVVVCGPSGTGKIFFLEALGQQIVEAGMRVAWFRLEDLGALVRAHRSDDSVSRVVARILRADLIVVDDIGLLEVGADAAEGLYRLVDAAYEKRSIAVSSNLHPAGFDELMPKTLATATVDRLLHHAHVCQTSGDSIRLTQALAGKGVTAMS